MKTRPNGRNTIKAINSNKLYKSCKMNKNPTWWDRHKDYENYDNDNE